MVIRSTTDYLRVLDDIAQIVEKDSPSVEELKELKLKQAAVRDFELKEIKKYPAQETLTQNIFKSKFNWN